MCSSAPRLRPGEWLLVHGGTSGIGTTAIQIAAALGAKVIATVGSAEKSAPPRRWARCAPINYAQEDFVEAVRVATGGHGADVILDMVGGDYIERNSRPPPSRAVSCRSPSSRAPRSRSI